MSGQSHTVAYDTDSVGHEECCITGRDARYAETVVYPTNTAFKLRAERQKIWGSIPGTDKEFLIFRDFQAGL